MVAQGASPFFPIHHTLWITSRSLYRHVQATKGSVALSNWNAENGRFLNKKQIHDGRFPPKSF
jgi:hypothetical protein